MLAMSIRTRTLLIVGITSLVLIGTLYAFSHITLLQGFVTLEQETVARNIERALNATEEEIAFLRRTSHDYAQWDDTYNYIRGLDDSYIEANAFEVVFRNYGLNFILFVNDAGEIIYSQGFDLETEELLPVSENLLALVTDNDALIHPRDAHGNLLPDGLAGIVILPEGGTILSAAPIFPSNVQGMSSGALIWGRFIDDPLVARLSEHTELTLSINSVLSPTDDPHYDEVFPALLDQPFIIQSRGDDIIDGHTLLRDINNQPALILEVEMPRGIYQQGKNSLSYFLISLVLLGVISALTIALLLEKGVLSRVAYLSRHVSQIQTSGDMTSRLSLSGDDELTNLTANVNAMLESLQVQEKIKLARDNALEAARLKAEILANVSHDARTPLTVIQMRTELMLQGIYGTLNERQQKILATILTSAHQLLGFVNNLLEGSQLEAGHLQLKIGEFEPAQLLSSVETMLSPLAAKKNLQLKTELGDNVPLIVLGDQSRLDRILTNLVSNAIKFTGEGSVTAKIYRVDSAHWALEVEDTGIGISQAQQEHIFTPFWQVDSSTTRAANSGVGLGLAIVQQLTHLMGGQVSVKSTLGNGSIFTVVLPLLVPTKEKGYAAETIRVSD
jgi:signal transduction histidine kinase